MKFTYNDGILKITLPERINTTNATEFERELFAIDELNDSKEFLFDANNVKFISSLGLRVIFKFLKELTTFQP